MIGRLAILGGGLALFAILHSVLAAERVRRPLERGLGDRPQLYRGLYNLLAVAILLAALLASRGPVPLVWRATGMLRVALWGLEGVLLAGWIATVWRFDLPCFLGFAAHPRASRSRSGGSRSEALQTHGAYALCRHPLYFFTAAIFSAWPSMNLRWLLVAVWLWVYAYIGSIFEERKLLAAHGGAYRTYRDTHWRLLPFGPRRSRAARVAAGAASPPRARV